MIRSLSPLPIELELCIDRLQFGKDTLSTEFGEGLSPDELDMRNMLADFCGISADHIDRNTTIYQLGLDSITYVQFAAKLRAEKAIEIRAADVLQRPQLKDLAELLSLRKDHMTKWSYSFGKTADSSFNLWLSKFDTTIAIQNGLPIAISSQEAIDGVWPCTPLQTGIISQFLASKPGQDLYVNVMAYDLPFLTTSNRISRAWDAVSARHPILRTGFVETQDFEDSLRHGGICTWYLQSWNNISAKQKVRLGRVEADCSDKISLLSVRTTMAMCAY